MVDPLGLVGGMVFSLSLARSAGSGGVRPRAVIAVVFVLLIRWSAAGSSPTERAESRAGLLATAASSGTRGPSVWAPTTPPSAACVADTYGLCLDGVPGDRRFQIQASYQTTQSGGLAGRATAIPLASVGIVRGGVLWFFDKDNPEVLVKLLDGCAVNGSYWFFASAGTNVGLTLSVTDTVTGDIKTYTNPDLNPASPIQDVTAFPVCN